MPDHLQENISAYSNISSVGKIAHYLSGLSLISRETFSEMMCFIIFVNLYKTSPLVLCIFMARKKVLSYIRIKNADFCGTFFQVLAFLSIFSEMFGIKHKIAVMTCLDLSKLP